MIGEKEKKQVNQPSADITGGGRDQNYILVDTTKKELSEDSMESIRSEKESEVKSSDEDDGNASESDSKDGSFISDMLPQNKKYG